MFEIGLIFFLVGRVLGYLLTSGRRGLQGVTTLWPGELRISLVPVVAKGNVERERGPNKY